MMDFWIFDFLFFKISDISLLLSKITIFIIEMSLNYIYIQNLDEITPTDAGWAWSPELQKIPKNSTSFFETSGSSKIHPTDKHSNTCHELNFHRKLIFFNACNNVLYQNQ